MGLAILTVGCAGPQFTVDDGRKVDEVLLGHIRQFGAGEQALRPAIARTAALKDPECDKQWELPFSVATADELPKDDRVAWVRALGVDERLTVIGVTPDSPLKLRDRIVEVAGYRSSPQSMLERLADRRDDGKPFQIKLSTEQAVAIRPFQVCRGYARLAPPTSPKSQDYHWLMSVHPLEVVQGGLTDDEALWMVLWSQGVSEEGGARMKTYHYTTKVAGALYNLFTIATGIKGAALAAETAVRAAQSAAANAASSVLRQQAIDYATSAATQKLRDEVSSAAQRLTKQQAMSGMQQAAANRGSLSGVARVAATVFDRADTWAYDRMDKLHAPSLAGFRLHQKLLTLRLNENAMVFDPERMAALSKRASEQGRGDEVTAILEGLRPDEVQLALNAMPLATAPGGFSYEDESDAASAAQPFARGLVDGILTMPVESSASR